MGNQHSNTEYKDRLGRNKMVMDRLRRSLRESFRRRKEHMPECSKPHQWQADEAAVRAGTCNFTVKYLGCVEVFESRGMQVCEEALKVLRNSRRRPIKGTLFVTGDGLRVVDEETKGLIVDQTIEKVSFCAPDRNHEKGFSYICRDGTTRRWMCHGFLALRDSGERLSHAVGCAFAVCLEKKQKRDKDSVMVNFDPKTSTFTRTGSFRQTTLTERMQEMPENKSNPEKASADILLPPRESSDNKAFSSAEPAVAPSAKQVHNPYAIERPHATPMLLQRQGSFRGFGALNQTSPFKRQLSLRINELPSTLERQRAMSLESSDLFSMQNGLSVTPIPESSPVVEKDSLSAMCQQITQGLSLLSGTTNGQEEDEDAFATLKTLHTDQPFHGGAPWSSSSSGGSEKSWMMNRSSLNASPSSGLAFAKVGPNMTGQLGSLVSPPLPPLPALALAPVLAPPLHQPVAPPRRSSPNFSHLRSQSVGSAEAFYMTAGQDHNKGTWGQRASGPAPTSAIAAAASAAGWTNGSSSAYHHPQHHPHPPHHHHHHLSGGTTPFRDPFDAEWAVTTGTADHPAGRTSTNPFVQNSAKTFQVQL